jgi:hypothetical protein
MNGTNNKIVCFGVENTGAKVTNPKIVLGSSWVLRVIFFSYDIQQSVSIDQAFDKLSCNKD